MRSLVVATMLTLLAGASAWAQAITPQSQTDSLKVWRAEDDCARKSYRQYPDYTRDSNAKRERAMRACLATGSLPPREDVSAPAAAPANDQKR